MAVYRLWPSTAQSRKHWLGCRASRKIEHRGRPRRLPRVWTATTCSGPTTPRERSLTEARPTADALLVPQDAQLMLVDFALLGHHLQHLYSADDGAACSEDDDAYDAHLMPSSAQLTLSSYAWIMQPARPSAVAVS